MTRPQPKRHLAYLGLLAVLLCLGATYQAIPSVFSAQKDELVKEGAISSYSASQTPVLTWEKKKEVEQIINTNQGRKAEEKTWESLTGFVVESADDPSIIYFTTSTRQKAENLTALYRYEIQTKRWQRLQKQLFHAENNHSAFEWMLAGKDNGSLVVREEPVMFDARPCFYPLIVANTEKNVHLKQWNMQQKSSELNVYTLTPQTAQAEQLRQKECQIRERI